MDNKASEYSFDYIKKLRDELFYMHRSIALKEKELASAERETIINELKHFIGELIFSKDNSRKTYIEHININNDGVFVYTFTLDGVTRTMTEKGLYEKINEKQE